MTRTFCIKMGKLFYSLTSDRDFPDRIPTIIAESDCTLCCKRREDFQGETEDELFELVISRGKSSMTIAGVKDEYEAVLFVIAGTSNPFRRKAVQALHDDVRSLLLKNGAFTQKSSGSTSHRSQSMTRS
jgi:hypothetical protein